jgi:hypothetical protein
MNYLSEDIVNKVVENIGNIGVEIAKDKTDLMREFWGIDRSVHPDFFIPFDVNVKDVVKEHNWKIRSIGDKFTQINYLMDFLGIGRRNHRMFHSESEDVVFEYSDFLKRSKGFEGTFEEFLSNFLHTVLDEHICSFCQEYGEPGYTKSREDGIILIADVNDIPGSMFDILEENGYDLEYSDEWVVDYEYDKAYRTQPNSYGWEMSCFFSEEHCEYLGIEDNQELYLEDKINDASKAVNSDFDLEKYGFEDIEQVCHETGWYGIVEDPEAVFEMFSERYDELVFQICSVGQFAVNWRIWGRGLTEKSGDYEDKEFEE